MIKTLAWSVIPAIEIGDLILFVIIAVLAFVGFIILWKA